MKILAFADLHFCPNFPDHFGFNRLENENRILSIIEKESPDIVAIAGDIAQSSDIDFCYCFLDKISSNGTPVVFCLGNHEFFDCSVKETISNHKQYCGKMKNIYCLDICGKFDFHGVRFVGNVLWYDGSLDCREHKKGEYIEINPMWRDCTIRGCSDKAKHYRKFNPFKENEICCNQIVENMKDYNGKSVLLTHCVPHSKLNRHQIESPLSPFNCYSGMKDFFKDYNLSFDVAICGHTHRKERFAYEEDGKFIRCYNIGNDYFYKTNRIEYETIDI